MPQNMSPSHAKTLADEAIKALSGALIEAREASEEFDRENERRVRQTLEKRMELLRKQLLRELTATPPAAVAASNLDRLISQ